MFSPPTKICPCCDAVISPEKRADAVFCSERCRQKMMRTRNREYHLLVRRKSRADNPLLMKLARSKHEAKKKGIPFNIALEDLGDVPEICPVLGIPLVWNLGAGRKGYHPNSPSLDRIEPDQGYVRGNVRIISARANLLKNNATVEELEAVLNDLKRLRGYNQ